MNYKNRRLRHELKFPATAAQCEILRQRFSAVMKHDANAGEDGIYRITSLYLDDAYNSGYNDKLLGADTRKKYRIRTYNLSPDKIHLECKYKDTDMVSKRGAWITREQYEAILKGDFTFTWDNQYSGTVIEDFGISNSLAHLSPSVIVDYNREAFVVPEGNVRFTIDSGFKVGTFSSDMFAPEAVYVPVTDIAAVIELKYDDYLPSYLFDLVQGVNLTQQSVSKFVMCKDKLLTMNTINTIIR